MPDVQEKELGFPVSLEGHTASALGCTASHLKLVLSQQGL